MDHLNLDKTSSSAPMIPKDDKQVVTILAPHAHGKTLIREDTILTGLPGCAGCGRTQFTCTGVQKQWSVLCWGKQSDKKYYTLLVLFSATFALSLIGTIFFCFTNTVNNVILSSMVIRNNSLAYHMWKRPTVQPLMKVHIFNYTNWQRVRDGLDTKLHVEDIGPYVYSQQLERVNVKFDGDLLTYQERNKFEFLPEKSVGPYLDRLFVPNLPLLAAAAKVQKLPYLAQLSLVSVFNHHQPFIELPVQGFLWGYDDEIIDLVKPVLSIQGKLNFNKFGLLATKNGTVSDVLTINTGENDKDKMNIIQKLNGEEHLSYWGSPECNSLASSDGSIFPPSMLDRNTTLYVLFANLCRRLPFKYQKDIVVDDGIQLLRYVMPDNVFDNPTSNPSNQCFCEINSGVCPPRGVINVTECAMGAPALASFPHFYRAAPFLREKISGLKPDPELHYSYVDIHPTMGIALSGRSNMQLNMQVRKPDVLNFMGYLEEELILPIAWVEMSVEELPESLRSLVYHGTYSTAAAQLGLIVMCVISLLVSGLCLFIMLVRKRRKPCGTIKIISVDNELKAQMS